MNDLPDDALDSLPLAPVFCKVCGHRNERDANFCSSCGSNVGHDSDDETTGMQSPLDVVEIDDQGDGGMAIAIGDSFGGTSLLVVTRGPNAGERYALDADITRAGRHPDSDVFLDDITVSRRHVDIVREGDGYLAKDAGSLNGTYLNRVRIDAAELNDGDELQIGKFRLVFVAGLARES